MTINNQFLQLQFDRKKYNLEQLQLRLKEVHQKRIKKEILFDKFVARKNMHQSRLYRMMSELEQLRLKAPAMSKEGRAWKDYESRYNLKYFSIQRAVYILEDRFSVLAESKYLSEIAALKAMEKQLRTSIKELDQYEDERQNLLEHLGLLEHFEEIDVEQVEKDLQEFETYKEGFFVITDNDTDEKEPQNPWALSAQFSIESCNYASLVPEYLQLGLRR